MNKLKYKGYIGELKYDADKNIFYGKILNIKHLVTFESGTLTNVKNEFHKSVDEYIEMLSEISKEDASDNVYIHGMDITNLINNHIKGVQVNDSNLNKAIQLTMWFIHDLKLTLNDIKNLYMYINNEKSFEEPSTLDMIIKEYELNSIIISYILDLYKEIDSKAKSLLSTIVRDNKKLNNDNMTYLILEYAIYNNINVKINDNESNPFNTFHINGYSLDD